MRSKAVPDIVISRLPLYLRTLSHLAAEGKTITSSQELGQRLGLSSAQIRKDLSHFGEFGKQGTGYDIEFLQQQLKKILKVDRRRDVCLIGAGDLGHAIVLHHEMLEERGFHLVAVFDHNPRKIGKTIGHLEVIDSEAMPTIIRDQGIQIAIIAVPARSAQSVADTLVEAGIRAILSYAPITLNVPEGVQVQYIDPVIHLQHMTYYL